MGAVDKNGGNAQRRLDGRGDGVCTLVGSAGDSDVAPGGSTGCARDGDTVASSEKGAGLMDRLMPVANADSEVETSPGIVAYGQAASNHFTLTAGDERKRLGTQTRAPRTLSPHW